MKSIRELDSRIAELKRENAALHERIASLARRVPSAPESAEYRISRLIGGTLTSGSAAHDIVCARGKKFEVKFSRLNAANLTTRRWSWGHPLGSGGAKSFFRLILVGETDPRFARSYRCPKSPYVLFDIPFRSVRTIMRRDALIQITTNPDRISAESARLLFERYQVTSRELRERYKSK